MTHGTKVFVQSLFVAALLFLLLPAQLFAQDVVFGPGLEADLNAADPAEQFTVVVTFDQEGALSPSQVAAIEALGITQGITFQSLPMAGLLATPAQVYGLAEIDGVYSIWPNEEQTYYNADARALTGVDKVRTDGNMRTSMGLPFSGQGVTVVVHDSGIDGTHPDLKFGANLVENVLGSTNLNATSALLPVTYTEGVINTDTNSGHGTHVAGTVGGTGAASGGLHEGVAPGADLVGYGSGGVLLILDTIGGFDYAITHQFSFDNPIRVITNSWGSSGTFNPAHPVVQASYRAVQRNINVLFAAGNDGSGEDTHNRYASAPWIISVGAGEKNGALAGFSSRGLKGQTFTFTTYDGKEWTAVNEPTVVAPGVDIISACSAGSPLCLLGIQENTFYTQMQGTSMATPHVAGIVALMLEADPTLSIFEIKDILQRTATNMPGRESWEVGAGHVNAYNAMVEALGFRSDFGATVNATRSFNSEAVIVDGGSLDFSLFFSPVGDTDTLEFYVDGDVSVVKARASVPDNTVAIVLNDPDGNRYGSSITLPVLGSTASATAPGKEGWWTITVRGIGSISGVPVDPLGVTNGTALPGTINGTIRFEKAGGYLGLDDVGGHAAEGFIQSGVAERLFDGLADGTFRPDEPISRIEMADYLTMGAGIRQSLPLSGFSFGDVPAALAPFAEAVAAQGAALKDRTQFDDGVLTAAGSSFDPFGGVSRVELAYALMQSYGFEDIAAGFDGDVVATFNGERIVLDDQDDIPDALKGYVQLALDTGVLYAKFSLEQGPFDPVPTIHAAFDPNEAVTRAEYAVAAVRFFSQYDAVDPTTFVPSNRVQENTTLTAQPLGVQPTEASIEVDNYPNPFNPTTAISFTLPAETSVRLTVYDLLGRQVRVLVDGAALSSGTHNVRFEAGDLASGTYLYRLETPTQTITKRMLLVK